MLKFIKNDYYKIQNDRRIIPIDNTYISQNTKSNVGVHIFVWWRNNFRNNLNFYQNGENCNSILYHLTIINANQHVDHYTLVSHAST